MSNKILIQGLRIYANHGVMPQELTIGAYFTIDVCIETDFSRAIETDDLDGTISYADIFATIKREMSKPSQLLEHAAGRIAKAILNEFASAQTVKIRLMKENPPMGADCQGAGVEMTLERQL